MATQDKALILLITDQQTQLLLWQQRKLAFLGDFKSANEDRESFTQHLSRYPDHRLILVTDLIDENFRHDTIIHVGGADREALIKRKLDFAFRTTRYRIGKVKGREKDGRKQDKLMLAAISKPDAIDGWVDLLLEKKRAIQSITSIAWLLRHSLSVRKLEKERALLLACVDPGNSLRQSFFQDGKLLFSRLTNLSAQKGQPLASEIRNETLQVRQYLERIQFVPYESNLRIQLLLARPKSELQLVEPVPDNNIVEFAYLSEELGKTVVDVPNELLTPNHFILARVLAATSPANIYAPASATRYHNLLRIGSLITLAAGILLVIGILGVAPMVLWANQKLTEAQGFVARTQPLLREYSELSKRFPETELPPVEMALVVDAYSRLKSQSFSPISALNDIGRALQGKKGIHIQSIEWVVEPKPKEIAKVDPANKGKKAKQPRKPAVPQLTSTPETELTAELLRKNARLKWILSGQASAESSFREAQNEVIALSDALAMIPNAKVNATRMPIDVRTDVELKNTVDDRDVRAGFTLEVTIAFDSPTDSTDAEVAAQP